MKYNKNTNFTPPTSKKSKLSTNIKVGDKVRLKPEYQYYFRISSYNIPPDSILTILRVDNAGLSCSVASLEYPRYEHIRICTHRLEVVHEV